RGRGGERGGWRGIFRSHSGSSGPQRLRHAFEQAGGTFLKFGQVLALQSDILPLEYCRELLNLLDRVPPFDYWHVERVFTEDLGRTPADIFEMFDPEPLATGSIGQVHRATQHGRPLAVKVRRPTIAGDFSIDIAIMNLTVRMVRACRIEALQWVVAPTAEFVAWTQ